MLFGECVYEKRALFFFKKDDCSVSFRAPFARTFKALFDDILSKRRIDLAPGRSGDSFAQYGI